MAEVETTRATIREVAAGMGAVIAVVDEQGAVRGYVTPDLARWAILRREMVPVSRDAIRARLSGEDWHAARRAAGAAWTVAEAEAMEVRHQAQAEAIREAHGLLAEEGPLAAAGSVMGARHRRRRVAHGWGPAPVGATGDIAGWAWSLAGRDRR